MAVRLRAVLVAGIAGLLLFLAYGVAQIYAGFIGIEHHLGAIWAWLALIASLLFRFTLPISIGAFFGAWQVWGWPWPLAAVFAAPGLLLIIPGAMAAIFAAARGERVVIRVRGRQGGRIIEHEGRPRTIEDDEPER